MSDELSRKLRTEREAARNTLTRLVGIARTQNRRLSAVEQSEFDRAETDAREIDERLAELDTKLRADAAAEAMERRYAPAINTETRGNFNMSTARSAMPGRVQVVKDESIYRPDESRSFFLDVNAALRGDSGARERLDRNARQVDDALAKRGETRAISTTNGSGGEFVPPLWLETQFIAKARPRRITADLIGSEPLPAGTDVINLPKVATGSKVDTQSTQNTGITQQDVTTTSVASSVFTLAGGQTMSLQLVEQSPINVDDVVMGDLAADYGQRLNTYILSGTGSAGQPTGILTLSGTNSVTWSGTALTGATSLYTAVASAIGKVFTSRYEAPNVIVIHPRRWQWMLAQVDTANRPIIVPADNGPNNAAGSLTLVSSDGPVGTFAGLPVYLDACIPTNLGTGTNEDRVIVMKTDDLRLWESHLRLEAFPQTYAQTMSLFIRAYNYASFQPGRYPESVSVISGSGLSQVLA